MAIVRSCAQYALHSPTGLLSCHSRVKLKSAVIVQYTCYSPFSKTVKPPFPHVCLSHFLK